MPDVPSGVGCTGVAYSLGYSACCASTARRSFSSASVSGTVRIHVMCTCGLQGKRATKYQDIDGRAERDDSDAERSLQRIVSCEQREQHGDECEEEHRCERIAPGPIARCQRTAAEPEQSGHCETYEQNSDEYEVRDDLIERAERHIDRCEERLNRDRVGRRAEARMHDPNRLEEHAVPRHRGIDPRQSHE